MVQHLHEAVAALHLAKAEKPVRLASAPNAAHYAGPLYLQQMMNLAAQEVPSAAYRFYLDCGSDAALAATALEMGFTHLLCRAHGEARRSLQTLARQRHAEIDFLE